MRIINPGGSGGSGTVQTDGVTIQGDGSVGNPIALLDAITDNVTLQGAGISSNKLAIKAVQTTFEHAPNLVVPDTLTANALIISPFQLPYPLTFAHIAIYVAAADGANNSDLGLYNSAGALVANIGAQHIGSTGEQSFATVQGSKTIVAGLYWFAITSAASTLTFYVNSSSMCLYYNNNFGVSAGGALPNSISPPAFSPARNTPQFLLL